jgi:hypothetical protein
MGHAHAPTNVPWLGQIPFHDARWTLHAVEVLDDVAEAWVVVDTTIAGASH